MLYPALVTAIIVFLTVGGQELLGFTMLGRPIVIAPVIGMLLGDVQTGLAVGASLEAIFMGVVNIGGASAAEPGLAAALATTFAIQFGGGLEVALPIALPLGVIGLQLKTLLYVGVVGPFASRFDTLADQGNAKGIRNLHFSLWGLQWFLYSLIPFFGVLVGSEATQAAINMLPDVILDGLSIAGGLLPAVGMAMLLQTLWDNKIAVFFFLGFILTAYLELPLIATAVLAFIVAFVIAQRDLQLKNLRGVKPQSSGTNENMTEEEIENEEFLS
ncbi:PTS mannose/fructose/sorbose/N-acetylgalactosamine transporter subunit IIC [Tetragenococcus halophilus]|uniref:PTS mannose/fructose/sorbose/N-acetylgalactosamine transporter subunit IIC n=1 Tax=Tetragenococcus halophilus TaxID=51669 RepID=UPI0015C0E1C4|nr:PTS sugar transporter subunit IIC [Tetragenococcus halophilus]NWO01250.1 PTS sugar transporter subunit IIC [Tetragenococcus halophilus]